MKQVLVFYQDELVIELSKQEFPMFAKSMLHGNYKVYNESYVYMKEPINEWFRMDRIPVSVENVPKQYRALLLIYT